MVLKYPSTWDKTHKQAVKIYERCKDYYDEEDEDAFVSIFRPSILSRVFIGFLLYYNLISFVLVIIKRNSYKKMKYNVTMCLLFSTGSLINILTYYFGRLMYYYFPCFLVAYSSAIGI